MISTPHRAYEWLRGVGLSHEAAMGISSDRARFEYFVAVINELR